MANCKKLSWIICFIINIGNSWAGPGGVINCQQTCSAGVKAQYRSYMTNGVLNRQGLSRLGQCFRGDLEHLTGGFSQQEVRNFFEISGRIISRSLSEMPTEETIRIEKGALLYGVMSGLNKYMWPIGATDCETHARNLKAHLEQVFTPAQFRFEVVNTFQDIDDKSGLPDFDGSLLPMGNHYLVRAISMQTGKSFIANGYTAPSVTLENDEAREIVVLDSYEECFFSKVMQLKLGVNPTDDYLGVLATFTPVVRSMVAREAKRVAGLCISGQEQVSVSGDLLP